MALCSVKAEVIRLGLHPKHMTVSPRSPTSHHRRDRNHCPGTQEEEDVADEFMTPLPAPAEPQRRPPSQRPGQHT